MCKEFNRVGVPNVRRFPAISHQNGERGCFESHMQCIFSAMDAGLSNVLIFEDDVAFLDCYDERKFTNAVTALDKTDWEFFYLGGLETRIRPKKRYMRAKQQLDGNFDGRLSYIINCWSVGWAQSYAVNSRIFERIRHDYDTGLWETVNLVFNGKPGGADKYYQKLLCPKTYVCVPAFTSQYDIVSDLTRTKTNQSLRIPIR